MITLKRAYYEYIRKIYIYTKTLYHILSVSVHHYIYIPGRAVGLMIGKHVFHMWNARLPLVKCHKPLELLQHKP